ncbi:unnamed protein product [Arctia plantaginis]|uniref:Peptidase S1 domain-containing protein n=1 Tax=Arctia plantaginis TaxID=874455 RepID=A0A8S0ZJ45_ARCPL|nr:unnamed protein product [Arctia plantaginis]CAB3238081.1 unnamed protein product [Arctia plantaginis]
MASLTWFVLLLAGLTYTHALGTQTTIQNLPSMAQVEFRLGAVWRQQCIGSIITNYHVLSAGTCFQNHPSVRLIRVGSGVSGVGGTSHENIPIAPVNFYIPAHVHLSMAGWGITAQGGLVANNILYRMEVESKDTTGCAAQFPGRITGDNLYVGLVGRPGRDFDPSDTGAPILYHNILAGVASFGSSATYNLLPIVSTAISPYTNWIVGAAV